MENQAVTNEAPRPRPRATHEQTRERNAKFAEMAQDPEVKKYLDNMPKSTHISYLRKLCQDRYGFTVPASAAYKVMSTIDDRFKPKHRGSTRSHTETFVEVEPIVAPAADVADDEDVPEIKTN